MRVINADVIEGLKMLPDASVHCCVTSPPYWGLRDYGVEGQIGLESTPEAYVARMVEVFREVRRVLRDDGTLWLNLGDSYANNGVQGPNSGLALLADKYAPRANQRKPNRDDVGEVPRVKKTVPFTLKPKDLVGIPWRVAFALQADGWWLRQDIIWHKPNPMPESVRDRCTKAHEYVFLMAKSQRYFYDCESVKEELAHPKAKGSRFGGSKYPGSGMDGIYSGNSYDANTMTGRNRRSVWTVTTKPYREAHFAVMPPKLIEPCIKAGCPEGGTVLDPFAGSGTTLAVALELGRDAVGIELNPEYVELIHQRLDKARDKAGLFA